MTASRSPQHLVRWSWLLAATGILILVVAGILLASALYDVAQLTGYGSTYVVLAPGPAIAFAVTSLVVLAGSLLAWFRSRARGAALAGRLALAAIIATMAAWLAVGAAFLVLSNYFQNKHDELLHQAADAYALAYDLAPLRSGSKNELRLWFLEPMEGGISSAVFSESGALRCEGKSEYGKQSAIVPGRGLCRKVIVGPSKDDLESQLHSFSELVHKNTSCDDVMDGWSMTVDGVVDGKRFVLEARNPNRCDNADAKKLSSLLEDLDDLIKR